MKKIVVAISLVFSLTLVHAQAIIGEQAPEISLQNAKGETVTLSSFKGKVVLIDFWATWCGPCRAELPKIVKLYNKYKTNGFEVLGVSLDEKKKMWLSGIKKYKMNYTNVIDTKAWESAAAMTYGVEAIPSSFLVNKEGQIIAIDLEGMALEDAVKAVL